MVADYSWENVMSGCGLRGKLGYQTRACFSSLHSSWCVLLRYCCGTIDWNLQLGDGDTRFGGRRVNRSGFAAPIRIMCSKSMRTMFLGLDTTDWMVLMISVYSWNVTFRILPHKLIVCVGDHVVGWGGSFYIFSSVLLQFVVWSITPASLYELWEACLALLCCVVFLNAVWWLNFIMEKRKFIAKSRVKSTALLSLLLLGLLRFVISWKQMYIMSAV